MYHASSQLKDSHFFKKIFFSLLLCYVMCWKVYYQNLHLSRRKWQPTPVFLPGESQGRGRLVGCRLWGRTELDTTEVMQQQQKQQNLRMRPYLERGSSYIHLIKDLEIKLSWILSGPYIQRGFHGGSDGKQSACNAWDQVLSLGREDTLEKGMATHSGILAWQIPQAEKPGRLQSTGLQRAGHDWVTKHSIAYIQRTVSFQEEMKTQRWGEKATWSWRQDRNGPIQANKARSHRSGRAGTTFLWTLQRERGSSKTSILDFWSLEQWGN